MSPGVPTKLIGAVCGQCAFAMAIVAGLSAGNPAETVIGRAIVAMLCVQLVGVLCGWIAERSVNDAVRRYRDTRPIPEVKTRGAEAALSPAPTPASAGARVGAGLT